MLFGISKSTINGVLALLLAIFGAVLTYQVPTALLNPQVSHAWLWVTASLTLASGVLRAVVGFLQVDPDTPPTPLARSAVGTSAKILVFLFAAIVVFGVAGCTAANAPLPTGAVNAPDADTNKILQTAHAYAAQWIADVNCTAASAACTPHTPTAEERQAYDVLIESLNAADLAFQSWKTTLATNPAAPQTPTLTAAVADVKTKLGALTTLTPKTN